MPEFPLTEANIQALAQSLLSAMQNNFSGLQGAPVTAAELETILDGFVSKNLQSIAAHAQALGATKEKRAELAKLKRAMRQLLRFAESKNLGKPDMERIGWNTRHAKRAAQKPAPPLGLEIVKEGADWLSLRWKIDRDGGKAKFYRIMRRGANGEFYEVASSLSAEHNLIEQPRGEQLEFCVVAVNKAGESVPSNSVHAVL